MSRPLTIGIDARAATEVPAGRGRVVRELLRALADREETHHYRCYARARWEEALDERFTWVEIDRRDPVWHVETARLASRECEVFLSTNSYLTTWFLTIPGVPIVYDLVTFDRRLRPKRSASAIERLTLGLAVRRSAAFIAISQSTAAELVERFPRCAGRVTVARLGVAPALNTRSGPGELAQLPEPGFVLAVGTLEPRKNLPRLVQAYAQLPEPTRARHPLVVVGPGGWQTGETARALDSLGDSARYLGHVSDAALAELYRRCALFCYPSLGEGFGLPVLEAMAAGAAVLTSTAPALPEVGGDAVAYADPRDIAEISAQLERLLDDPLRREELGARAVRRAAQFSWSEFASATLDALERAA